MSVMEYNPHHIPKKVKGKVCGRSVLYKIAYNHLHINKYLQQFSKELSEFNGKNSSPRSLLNRDVARTPVNS